MKIAQWNYLGPRSTPQDIRTLRKESFDFHRDKGQPVILKHRWNWKDVKDGRAQRCPFHDQSYDGDSQFDAYCFGTGFLGGWDDGVVTFVTINDTQKDTIQILPQGQLLFETHPGFTAPWTPLMGDGDLLIVGEFDTKVWDLLQETDRYLLQEVTPRTIRGERKNRAGYRVHQQGNLDRLPGNHKWLDVPIVFDYAHVPPAPIVPPGSDPDDYTSITAELTRDIRVFGASSPSQSSYTERGIRVTGDTGGTHVVFEGDY